MHLLFVAPGLLVCSVIVIRDRLAPRVPGSLLALALAILGTWLFKLDQHGMATVGRVQAGLPRVSRRQPDP